jgi:cell division protein FtsW
MTTKKSSKGRSLRKPNNRITDRSNYYWLLGTIYMLILFGMVMILSASSVRAFQSTGDSYYYIKKQLVSLGIGSGLLFFCYLIPIKRLQSVSRYAVLISLAMLAAILVPGIGKEVDGASRWIPLGAFRLQPSEFAKIAVVMYTADYLARNKGGFKNIRNLQLYGVVMGLTAMLIMLQPDMGTTITICISAVAMLFISGLNLRYILGIFTTGGIVGALLIYIEPYRFSRFLAFLDPNRDPTGAGWQIKQSMIAFGSGGLLGVGLGMSGQKYFYLPAAHTDFIFAIIGEELGLIGTLFVLGLFTTFAYYGVRVSLSSKSRFSQLLGSGITAMIVLQAIVNMGAVTGILPVTGIPMPFISYGGSSLIVNLMVVGMLMRIAKENQRGLSTGRSTKPETKSRRTSLRAIDDNIDENNGRKKTKSRSGTSRKTASKKRASARKSNDLKKLKLVSSSQEDQDNKRGRESKQKQKSRTQKRQSYASNNKRGRDGGSRVSGSGSRKSAAKSK